MTNKICSKCKQEKSIKEFHRDIYNKDGKDRQCKECRNAYRRDYRKLKRSPIKKSKESCKRRLENRYNVSVDQYEILFKTQKGCCAICKNINLISKFISYRS